MAVDTIIVNGRVHTLDAEKTVARAVAVSNGYVTALGDVEDVLGLAAPSTQIIDVEGRAVFPAFTDSHTHLHKASTALAHNLDFMVLAPKTVQDVLDAVAARSRTVQPGSWIEGDFLYIPAIRESRLPDRAELDAVAPNNPVVLRGIGNHVVAASSMALQAAGIDRDTADPDGGRVERDLAGDPTGILYERGKLKLDYARGDTVIPQPGSKERLDALKDGLAHLHRYGIACIHEMVKEPETINDYGRLRAAGDLTMRIRYYIRGIESRTKLEYVLGLGLHSEFGDEWLRLGGVKFSIDGFDMVHNSALYHEFPGEPGNTGVVRIELEELKAAVLAADRGGLQVAVHAIGQRAFDMALDAFEFVKMQSPDSSLQHRIEHAYQPPLPRQLERMVELGITWSTQPGFLYEGGEAMYEAFGEGAKDDILALRTGADLGVRIQLNSDFPCSSGNPFEGIYGAVVRATRGGTSLGTREALTVDEALRYMTNTSDYSTSVERRQGRIAPGTFADLIATEADPYEVPPEELRNIEVGLTMVGGRTVHRTF